LINSNIGNTPSSSPAQWAVIAQAGTSGSSGSSGASGSSGSSGQSGSSGTSGTRGSSGTSGTSGQSGAPGSSGSSGQSGAAGSSGSSGQSGAAGSSGSSGSSGTSITISNNTDNYVLTATGTGINGEANLRFDGTNLGIGGAGSYPLDVIQTGGGSGTLTASIFRAGNNSDYFGNNQILFGYSGTINYSHAIKSRHNSANSSGNALDFYTWQEGQSISAVGNFHVMTIENNTKSPRVGIGISTPTSTLDVRGNANIKGDATDGGILTVTRRYSTGPQTINFNNNHPSSNLDWTGARITSADAGNYNGYLDFAVSLGSNGGETAGTAAVASVMRLTKDKRVGIGTTSPSKTLHVLTTDNEGIYLQGTGGGVWMDIQASGGQIHSVGAQVGGMGIYNRTASAYRFFITDAGNTGIGTASPSLHSSTTGLVVRGSARGIIELWDATSGKSVFQNVSGDTYIGQLDKGSGTGNTYVLVNGNGSSADVAMTLLANSNVGVGTTSPSVKLQVVGTNSTEGQLYVGNTDVTYSAGINFTTSGTNRGFVGWRHTNSGSPYSLTGIHLFNTDNSNIVFGTNGAVRAVINLNGNLGVGTTSPSYRLEVVTGGALAQRLQSSNSTVGNPIIDIYDAGRAQETVISSTDGTTTGTYIASYSNHPLLFGTNAGSSATAKVRIEADQVSSPISTMKIGPGGILWGGNNSGKEINSCQISAGYHQANSMNFVGMSTGTGSSDRRMDFWVEGGAFFRGTLTATGDIVAYGSTSDIRLKKNIVLINGALDTLMKVNGYTFQWNEKAPEEKRDKTEYGVIAQEVESAGLDLLIRDYIRPVNGTGGDDTPPEVWKSVQYEKFVPILIEAIKEQQGQIEDLKKALFNVIDNQS
jgi:hypothetical protein